VLGMTIDYQKQFKALADRLAREPISPTAFEQRVRRHLCVIDDDTSARARAHWSARSSGCWRSTAAAGRRGHDRQQARDEMDGVQRDRRALGLRPPLHRQDQPGAAVVRRCVREAESVRAGDSGLSESATEVAGRGAAHPGADLDAQLSSQMDPKSRAGEERRCVERAGLANWRLFLCRRSRSSTLGRGCWR
jgi:hypothetical protein